MESKLLVVDDELFVRELLAEYFTKLNYQVRIAGTAEEAFSFLKREDFEVALIDLRMPQAGGIELLRMIKQSSDDLAVILMTGYPTVDSVVSAMREGACDYVIKPFRLKELHAVVGRAIINQRQQNEIRQLRERVTELETAISRVKTRDARQSTTVGHRRFTIEPPVRTETSVDEEPILIAKPRSRVRENALADSLYHDDHTPQREYAGQATSLLEDTG